MVNVSWYGGASVRGQTWPINDQNVTMQPFVVSDLRNAPHGFGSVLERYFLGSSGEARGCGGVGVWKHKQMEMKTHLQVTSGRQ